MCKHSFTYAVKSTAFTNLSRKWNFRIETPLQTGEGTDFKMPCFRVFQSGLSEFFSNANQKFPVIVAFWNLSGMVCTENIWCVFRVKTLFSGFSSGALRTGPKAVINKWLIRSHKLAYSKRKEIQLWRALTFSNYFKSVVDWQKSPPNLEINYGRTVSSFSYFYMHSINETEMIKCSATVDIVAG